MNTERINFIANSTEVPIGDHLDTIHMHIWRSICSFTMSIVGSTSLPASVPMPLELQSTLNPALRLPCYSGERDFTPLLLLLTEVE